MGKQEKYYTIHFEDEGTGENFDTGVFATEDEAYANDEWEYPGYGSQWLKEISRAEALEAMIAVIDDHVDEWLNDDAIDVDPEDYEIVEPKWFTEAINYVKYGFPGWQLLYEEFIEDTENEPKLIDGLKKEMRICKELYESGKRNEMPDAYYDCMKVLKVITK